MNKKNFSFDPENSKKDRQHHNNIGARSAKTGFLQKQVELMAKRLGIPCAHNSRRTMADKLNASRSPNASANTSLSYSNN